MSQGLSAELQVKIEAVRARLRAAVQEYGDAVVFANSLGAEDMLLTDLIAREQLPIPLFVLDTGRLPEETLTLLAEVRERYPHLQLRVYYPQAEALQAYVQEQGINAFYQSVAQRKACCQVRKLEPLARALQGQKAWITGLRREQSVTRDEVEFLAWDDANQLYKLNPLADWKESEIWSYIKQFDVPYNVLHDQHYPSIGCAPCTRAISVGEDVRAGRWWWENPENKECGLHASSSLPLKRR